MNELRGLTLLPDENVSYLNPFLLDETGFLRPVPAAFLAEVPHHHLMIWGTKNAVYQYATIEMIDWLKEEIGDLSTIEICAGSGCIGRTLGIPSTDRKLQDQSDIRALYALMGQAVIVYPKDIIEMEADYAVMHYKPECVVGAFVTQYGTIPERNCSPFGPHETKILKQVKKYIHFGNKYTHEGKHIFKHAHRELSFPWLFSRAADPALNRVWVWDK